MAKRGKEKNNSLLYIVIIIIIIFGVIIFLKNSNLISKESVRGRGTGNAVTGEAIAVAPPGNCYPDFCGQQSPDGCYCDELCEGMGDCCSNYKEVCVPDCCSNFPLNIYPCGQVTQCENDDGWKICGTGTDCNTGYQCEGTSCVPIDDKDPCKNAHCYDVACGKSCEVTDSQGKKFICGSGTKCNGEAQCVNGQCQICAPN